MLYHSAADPVQSCHGNIHAIKPHPTPLIHLSRPLTLALRVRSLPDPAAAAAALRTAAARRPAAQAAAPSRRRLRRRPAHPAGARPAGNPGRPESPPGAAPPRILAAPAAPGTCAGCGRTESCSVSYCPTSDESERWRYLLSGVQHMSQPCRGRRQPGSQALHISGDADAPWRDHTYSPAIAAGVRCVLVPEAGAAAAAAALGHAVQVVRHPRRLPPPASTPCISSHPQASSALSRYSVKLPIRLCGCDLRHTKHCTRGSGSRCGLADSCHMPMLSFTLSVVHIHALQHEWYPRVSCRAPIFHQMSNTMLTVCWPRRRLPRGASGREGAAAVLPRLACGVRCISVWDRCCLSMLLRLLLLLAAAGSTRSHRRCALCQLIRPCAVLCMLFTSPLEPGPAANASVQNGNPATNDC